MQTVQLQEAAVEHKDKEFFYLCLRVAAAKYPDQCPQDEAIAGYVRGIALHTAIRGELDIPLMFDLLHGDLNLLAWESAVLIVEDVRSKGVHALTI